MLQTTASRLARRAPLRTVVAGFCLCIASAACDLSDGSEADAGLDSSVDPGVDPSVDPPLDALEQDADADANDDATSDALIDVTSDTIGEIDAEPVSIFGAVCDGTTDDTAALQAAFDSGENLSFEAGARCRIADQVNIDQAGDQIVVGRGATILATTEAQFGFFVDKPSGLLTVHSLHFDGTGHARRAWHFESAFILNGANVANIFNRVQNAVAYWLEVDGPWEHAEINDSTCDNIESEPAPDGGVDDRGGIARCVQIYWDVEDVPVTVQINRCILGNVWAIDGDVIENIHRLRDYDSLARLEVRDTVLFNAQRRLLKNRASNTYWENVTFTSAPPDHPKLRGTPTAGMIAMNNYGEDPEGGYTNRHVFRNCTFNGTTHENRFIITWVDDLLIADSEFNSATFAVGWRGGGVCFQNNTVDDTFVMYGYGGDGPIEYLGPIVETGTTPAGDYLATSLSDAPEPGPDFACPRPLEDR